MYNAMLQYCIILVIYSLKIFNVVDKALAVEQRCTICSGNLQQTN